MKLRQLVIAALAVSGAATLASANDTSKQISSSDSSNITQLQQALNDKGFNAGPVDGLNGPKTQAALKQFQQSQGIAASGKADSQTLAALGVSGSATASASGSQSSYGNNGASSTSSDTSLSSSPSASQGASSMGSSQPPSSSTSSDQSSNSSQQSSSANTSQSSTSKY
jgi:peptidoglycan hydrolase-like protein with peptidoglycan-binding domain